MLSKGLKCLYFAVLFCCVCFLVYQAQDDNSYTFTENAFTYDEETATLNGPYVSLWSGDYAFKLEYQTETDQTLIISTDRGVSEEAFLSAGEHVYEKQFATGRTDLFRLSIPNVNMDEITVRSFTMTSDQPLYMDTYFFALLVLLIGIGLFVILNSKWWSILSREQKAIGFILVGITIFACYPFFTTELVEGWDTWGHLLRIESVKDAFYLKQIPVSIFPNNCNGFGQLGAMYPLFLLYPFGVLRGLHVSLIVCYKLIYITATVASVFVMYYSMKTVIKSDYAALVASALYCIAPYRMEDIYCRHALGEILAMIFIPLIIAGVFHVFVGNERKYWPLLAIGYSGVLQSHIISFVLVIFMSMIIGIFFVKRLSEKSRLFSLLKAIGLTILLNIWYIIPFLTHFIYGTNNGTIFSHNFANKATSFAELISVVRFGGDGAQGIIGVIGIVCILCTAICLYLLRKKNKAETVDKFMGVLFGLDLFFIFMITTYFPWNLLTKFAPIAKLGGMIQFPFRILVIAVPLLYMVLGYFLEKAAVIQKYRYQVFTLLILITILGVNGYMFQTWQGTGERCKITGGITKIAIPENYPQGADEGSCQNESWYPYSYEMNIQQYEKKGTKIRITYSTTKDEDYIDLPLYYFAGYTAKVVAGEVSPGTQLHVEQGAEYRVRVHLPKSEAPTEVIINYTGLWFFYLGYIISALTMICCVVILLRKARKEGI